MSMSRIGKHEVIFDEERKICLVDGVRVPRVMEILRFKYPVDLDIVPLDVKRKARYEASCMRLGVEAYEKKVKGVEHSLEVRNYILLKRLYGISSVALKVPVLYEENGVVLYCGRVDQVTNIRGCLGLNVFKYINTMSEEKISQLLNLYRIAYQQSYDQDIINLNWTQLRKNVRSFNTCHIEERKALDLVREFYKEISVHE